MALLLPISTHLPQSTHLRLKLLYTFSKIKRIYGTKCFHYANKY